MKLLADSANHDLLGSTSVLVLARSHTARSVFRKALADGGFEVAEASDHGEALEALERFRPALVVIDFEHLAWHGTPEAIRTRHPSVGLMLLVSDADTAVDLDATAYYLKTLIFDELAAFAARAARGLFVMDPPITRRVIERANSRCHSDESYSALRTVERRVLAMLSQSLSAGEVVAQLERGVTL